MHPFLKSTGWFVLAVILSIVLWVILSFFVHYDVLLFFGELVSSLALFVVIFALIGFFRLPFHPIKRWYNNLYLLLFTAIFIGVSMLFIGLQGALNDLYEQQYGRTEVAGPAERIALVQDYLYIISGDWHDDSYLDFPKITNGKFTYYYNMDLARAEEAIADFEAMVDARKGEWEDYFGEQYHSPVSVVFYEHPYQLPYEDSNAYGVYQPYSESIHVPIKTNVDEEFYERILAHEYIHHLYFSFDDGVYAPDWLIEGVSVALEREEKKIEFDPRFQVAEFDAFNYEQGWDEHLVVPYDIYGQSGALLNTLFETVGNDFLVLLYDEMLEKDVEEAFEIVVGQPLKSYAEEFFEAYRFANEWLFAHQADFTAEEKIEKLEKIIKTIPNAVQAYQQLGAIYLEESQPDLAVAAYEKALELDPNNLHRYYYLSSAYLVIDLEQAINIMAEGLDSFEHNQYQSYLELIRNIAADYDEENPYRAYYRFIQSGFFSSEKDMKWLIQALIDQYDDIYTNDREQLEILLEELSGE
ncbi:hypothetical protein AJ85_04060 [Alkalihalobacillus alcalophilus ATCC 27647 = CGMCC 1.3604]|uniref:Uncharacterized protein n=1 Tax=Alkalihalobacillus alcalophilus ATCC 27647 = CGMCC 1.3604 TaxID=1218173 RepID=A0A094WQR8_ALKAL|nr:tetratricopeptide repeat protein [Alkalihalobacillus alcalophilus]KGA98378.1 hypothetical protein BALCAV_0204670 [Alkalihalobacillus alcalophilus ATCC 27647 = CGMCC 1.3604]MED1563677.1 hypothetical protein [Alkalihalobacillus alcalophilus]THG91626.1 hypothetical protein AJ85_04060 [Alkalihalobacillus alcalophilus ATCC 27647 = CGMCC 1.3604]